jgi:hypothetical protein
MHEQPQRLPRFHGYAVDVQLEEFRRVERKMPLGIEFVPFDSSKGKRLLKAVQKEQPELLGYV